MATIESYMGGMTALMGANYSPRASYLGAEKYTSESITFDTDKGMQDPHVKQYYEMRYIGTKRAQRDKLRTFMTATQNALRERLKSDMTDKDAQDVVDIVGRMNLVLKAGYPEDMEPEVKAGMAEINDLTKQLMELRQAKWNAYVKSQNKGTTDSGDGVPGGGAASSDLPAEKTALQKYGPVAALAAGGIAAYLALR